MNRITCQYVKKRIGELSGIRDFGKKYRKREYADLKKIYCKLCRQFTKHSLAKIGMGLYPNYNHDGVLKSIRKFDELKEELLYYDKVYKPLYYELLRKSRTMTVYYTINTTENRTTQNIKVYTIENDIPKLLGKFRIKKEVNVDREINAWLYKNYYRETFYESIQL